MTAWSEGPCLNQRTMHERTVCCTVDFASAGPINELQDNIQSVVCLSSLRQPFVFPFMELICGVHSLFWQPSLSCPFTKSMSHTLWDACRLSDSSRICAFRKLLGNCSRGDNNRSDPSLSYTIELNEVIVVRVNWSSVVYFNNMFFGTGCLDNFTELFWREC